ncbi:hypothetical protein L1987_81060 [Smallanthus sonchifolius]|uniref:Uncharacterized protein n=1 Tax=Smallanthus sonchifolius TaxID=185202 RepID=A0ACB8YPF1_9ASTR|nr:hypothetical protein L1987_81060 [Smallanthus sonchifolius]
MANYVSTLDYPQTLPIGPKTILISVKWLIMSRLSSNATNWVKGDDQLSKMANYVSTLNYPHTLPTESKTSGWCISSLEKQKTCSNAVEVAE